MVAANSSYSAILVLLPIFLEMDTGLVLVVTRRIGASPRRSQSSSCILDFLCTVAFIFCLVSGWRDRVFFSGNEHYRMIRSTCPQPPCGNQTDPLPIAVII